METLKEMTKTNALKDVIFDEKSRSIRIGVAIAEENAAKESKKRRINAPLSTVEKIFLHSSR